MLSLVFMDELRLQAMELVLSLGRLKAELAQHCLEACGVGLTFGLFDEWTAELCLGWAINQTVLRTGCHTPKPTHTHIQLIG